MTSMKSSQYTQYMQYHVVIGKFMRLWLLEKDLLVDQHWTWKLKVHEDPNLGSKGFFTTIIKNLEYMNRLFENGPYFFNFSGLYLQLWMEESSPNKEDFTRVSMWIHLHLVEQYFWDDETLEGIKNTLICFVKIFEVTKQAICTSYSFICAYMNVSTMIPQSIFLSSQDTKCIQTINYDTSPLDVKISMSMGTYSNIAPSTSFLNL
jgi:hypothetical protein